MEMNGLMGGLYRISEWIMRFSVINVLWVIFGAPVFFFAYTILRLLVTGPEELIWFPLILMGVISPFIWFPATAAMFSVARKWVLGDVDVPLFKTFIRSYKENYVQSMFGGIIYTVLIFLMVINFRFYSGLESDFKVLSILFLMLSILISVSLFHFFSILSHLHMKTLQIVKNAIMITLGRPLTTIMIGMTNGFILYISFFHFTFLIPFFMGSVIAYMSFFHFHRMFQKFQDKHSEDEENEDNEKSERISDGEEQHSK